MNTNTFRYGVAAAAVVILALIGWRLLPGANTGGPSPATTPSPTGTPVPALNGQTSLEPGTYEGRLPRFGDLAFRITVPEGWAAGGSSAIRATGGFNPPDLVHGMLIFEVENLYADPASPSDGTLDPPVGPTVDDLVTALAAQDGYATSEPVDVTVGGYAGKMLELTVPENADFIGCDATGTSSRPFAIWKEPGSDNSWRCMQGPGQTDYVYIVDVAGDRVVITLFGYPDWSGRHLAELQAMVDSLEFIPR